MPHPQWPYMQKAAIQNVPPLMHVRDNLQQFIMSISHFGVIFEKTVYKKKQPQKMLAKDFEIVIYYMLSLSKITNKKLNRKKGTPWMGL
jgi:hypothetical protein